MGKSGDRERKWEGKFLPTRAKYFVFALNKVKSGSNRASNGPKRAKIVVVVFLALN